MNSNALKCLATAIVGLLSNGAVADTLEYSAEIPPQLGTFDLTTSVSKFDPSLGALTGAALSVDGRTTIRIGLESLNSGPSSISYQIQTKFSVSSSALSSPIEVPFLISKGPIPFPTFDGVDDYAGSSGLTRDESVEDSRSVVVPVSDLGLFTGAGAIDFRVKTGGSISDSGPGNMSSYYSTQAGATVRIVYTFIPTDIITINRCENVPVPASITRRISDVRHSSEVIANRTKMFAAKARACGATVDSSSYNQSIEILRSIATLLKSNFIPSRRVCTNSICKKVSTRRISRQLQAYANKLSSIQIRTKLGAIAACNTASTPETDHRKRKNSTDYKNDLLSDISSLPKTRRSCSRPRA